MALRILWLLILGYACAAPAGNADSTKTAALTESQQDKQDSDLKTDASTYYDRYSDTGSRGYPSSGYGGGVTGYGTIDDRYSNFGGINGNAYGGYAGAGGYGNSGYDGYRGGFSNAGYGNSGYGNSGYGYNTGGYSNGGYGSASYGGNGGYGGYTGNGGLNSYYGYNNPSYQGYGHLGYGYYNKRPGYGNIYGSAITPSLVTGYRGYSRK